MALSEHARSGLESLVAIAMQAYAELNRWREVVPFVAQTYTGIEDCPSLIAHLCLSLHVRLQDTVTCSIIANIWLKNPSNFQAEGYKSLAEMYIVRVLCAWRRWDEVQPFLDSCPGLSETLRNSMAREVAAYRHQLEQIEADHIEVLQSDSDSAETSDHQTSSFTAGKIQTINDWLPQWMKQLVGFVKQHLQRWTPYISLPIVRHICIALVIVYVALSRWTRGLLKSTIVLRVLSALAVVWRGMFAPFYMINH